MMCAEIWPNAATVGGTIAAHLFLSINHASGNPYPMKRWLLTFAALPLVANASPPLQCDVGPVTKVFGAAPGLVYSCNDASSVVLISAPGSPATSFYFIFSLEGAAYKLRGEGTGAEFVSDAARKDLQALSRGDVERLRRETLASKKQ